MNSAPNTLNSDDVSKEAAVSAYPPSKKLSYHEGLLRCSTILLSAERNESTLQEALEILLSVGNIDRAFINQNIDYGEQGLCMQQIHFASACGNNTENTSAKTIAYSEGFQVLEDALSRGHHLIITPEELTGSAQAQFTDQSIQTSLLMPIFVQKRWWGYIGFDYLTQENTSWKNRHVSLIATAAELIGAFLCNREITEELAASKLMLNRVIDHTPTRVYWKDENLRFIGCNKQFANDHGLETPAEIVGKSEKDIPYFQEQTGFENIERSVLKNQKAHEEDERLHTLENKDKIWINVNQTPLLDETNKLIGVLGTYDNVSRLKEAKTVLEEAHTSINNIINSLNAGVFVVDKNLNALYYNNRYLELWEIGPEYITDPTQRLQSILALITNPSKFEAEILSERTAPEKTYTTNIQLKDGRHIERISAPYMLHGELIGQVISYRDISERKKTEQLLVEAKEEADRANRAKSEFLAMMSHELRTPMNAIIGFTELLFESIFDSDSQEYLNFISRNGEHLLQLIDQILDLAKIEAGSVKLQREPIYPWKMAGNIIRSLHPRTIGKEQKLIYTLAENVPHCIWSDEIRLKQILFNLLGNAVKFTQSGTVELHVDIKKIDQQDFLRFRIKDNGIGLSVLNKQELFDPFSQGDSSTTRKYGGTGLGLTISQKLVQQMGGEIWAKNRKQKGATFGFTLPLDVCNRKPNITLENQAKLNGKSILVVEYNETQLNFLKTIFQRWGMQVNTASNVQEATQLLKNTTPNVITFAIHHLNEEESDFIDMVRYLQKNHNTPILGLTEDPHSPQLDETWGITFQIIKRLPIDVDEIQNCLITLMSSPEFQYAQNKFELSPDETYDAQSMRVLIVEDNEDNQKLTLSFLKKLGHTAIVANSGDLAIKALSDEAFDLLLMDIQMSGIDGLQTTQNIRSGQAGEDKKEIPIVALTASAMRGDREKCLQAGMNDYLSKPVRLNDLKEVLDHYWSLINK